MNGFGRGKDGEKKEKASFITRETVGMTLLLFAGILFLIAVTGQYLFGSVGVAINGFLVGLAGWLIYPLLILTVFLGVSLVAGKKFVSAQWILRGTFLVLAIFLIVHTATAERFYNAGEFAGYGGYLRGCWDAAKESVSGGTGGGAVLGLIAYPVRYLLSVAGAYVLYSLLIVLALYVILLGTPLKKVISLSARTRTGEKSEKPAAREDGTDGVRAYPAPVAFEDLERARASADAHEPREPRREEEVVPRVSHDDYSRSRDILFGDAAADYRRNLIFNNDSNYNARRRGGVPESAGAGEVRAADRAPVERAPELPRYSEGYSEAAEAERPVMPRRVTEDKPAEAGGYSYKAGDLSYPARPTFRAADPEPETPARPSFRAADPEPETPVKPSFRAVDPEPETPANPVSPEPVRDFYAHDVPVEPIEPEETFSSGPNVADFNEPPAREELPPAQEEDEASSRRSLRDLFSRPVQERTPLAPPPAEEPRRDLGLRGLTRSVEEEPAEEPRRDLGLRGLSRGVEEEPAEEPRRDLGLRGLSRGVEEEPAEEPRRDLGLRGLSREQPAPVEEPREFDAADDAGSSRVIDSRLGRSRADLFDDDDIEEPAPAPAPARDLGRRQPPAPPMPAPAPAPAAEQPEPKKEKHIYKPYVRPTIDLFLQHDETIFVPQDEIQRNSDIIIETLASFDIMTEVTNVVCGARVTRYDVEIPKRISVTKLIAKADDLSVRLMKNGVNTYINHECGVVSVEVPNEHPATIGMRSLIASPEFTNAKKNSLTFVLGKTVDGKTKVGDIQEMTHLLVAGTTGSGKSVFLHSMLTSLICKYSPEELRLILVDPKKTEFAVYEDLPHLMINEIITEPQKVIIALNWAIEEMERRYGLFLKKGQEEKLLVRKIDEYNERLNENEERLPKILIVTDEFADLMSSCKKEIEDRIQRIAQKARAAGIHLVLATQRPSANVVTGTIKGNLPTSIALAVKSDVDSRIILGENGAEDLLGKGDMFVAAGGPRFRVQGAYLKDEEIQSVVDFVKANNEAYYDESVSAYVNKPAVEESEGGFEGGDEGGGSVDPQYIQALKIVVKLGQASISLIQRKCGVGYNHAGKIVEWMEAMGYIAPFEGKSKARDVLLTKEEFESKYGSLD